MKKKLRLPLFVLTFGLVISGHAWATDRHAFSFWIGGILIGQAMVLTVNAFEQSGGNRSVER